MRLAVPVAGSFLSQLDRIFQLNSLDNIGHEPVTLQKQMQVVLMFY